MNAQVDELTGPPSTRAKAARLQRFSSHAAFADSVVDALELYLAGQNDVDRKLLPFLEVVLVQRAQPDDLTVLMKLIDRYTEREDVVSLLGISHRLRLYEGHPSLGGVIKHCEQRLQRFDTDLDNAAWADLVGIQPTADHWNVSIRLGTAPPEYWRSRKSALKPQDTSLDLLVSSPGQWRVQIARVDRQYSAQWRPAGITIDTDVPRLKQPSAWPMLRNHALWPLFATNLERPLKLQWQRTALISLTGATFDRERLLTWLYPCADNAHS